MVKNKNNLTLEEMLTQISFKSLDVINQGDGWYGKRYQLHTYNYGSSYVCMSLEEIKQWIVKKLSFQLKV